MATSVETIAPDTVLSDTEHGLIWDTAAELEAFVRLGRLGCFKAAREMFAVNLATRKAWFPITAEYAELLLDQGDCETLASLCVDLVVPTDDDSGNSSPFSTEESQLLRLICVSSGMKTPELLHLAIFEARQARRYLESSVVQVMTDVQQQISIKWLEIMTHAYYTSSGVDIEELKLPWLSAKMDGRGSAWTSSLDWFGFLFERRQYWKACAVMRVHLTTCESTDDIKSAFVCMSKHHFEDDNEISVLGNLTMLGMVCDAFITHTWANLTSSPDLDLPPNRHTLSTIQTIIAAMETVVRKCSDISFISTSRAYSRLQLMRADVRIFESMLGTGSVVASLSAASLVHDLVTNTALSKQDYRLSEEVKSRYIPRIANYKPSLPAQKIHDCSGLAENVPPKTIAPVNMSRLAIQWDMSRLFGPATKINPSSKSSGVSTDYHVDVHESKSVRSAATPYETALLVGAAGLAALIRLRAHGGVRIRF